MKNNKILKLYQGLARYVKKPIANQGEYELNKIEKWRLERVKDFTLSIPEKENMIAVCKSVESVGTLEKIAEIYSGDKNPVLKYTINTSHIVVSGEKSIGYLEVNLHGMKLYYEMFIKAVPDYSGFEDGAVAFVDGSSDKKIKLKTDEGEYYMYGSGYMFYRNGENIPFLSSEEEKYPIDDGLKGISSKYPNVYAEINAAIATVKKADNEGIKKVRIYYDCEQVGGNAPGGANPNATSKISKKYAKFWNETEFKNLERIELIHVDAHTQFDLNEAVDKLAKKLRDDVAEEYRDDLEKRFKYEEHKNDYV